MNISKSTLAWLCFAWAIGLLLGLSVGLNIPFLLFLLGTILMLV